MKVVEKKKGDEEWFGKQQASLTTEQPLGGFCLPRDMPARNQIDHPSHPSPHSSHSLPTSLQSHNINRSPSKTFFRVLLVLQARVVFLGNLFGFTTPCIRRYLPITSS